MGRSWTEAQRLAIDTRDRTLLVSAAAGSGKTATLTERIIRSVLDEENPADIGNMLIATFTNAAVDELRERISAAIKKASAEHPENRRLEEQVLRIKDARILTITSFCNTILRTSAEKVGLPPNYRIAEPAEAAILFSSVMEGMINSAYEGELEEVCTPEEFVALTDCLTNTKNENSLAETIERIYLNLCATEKGIDTLLPLISEYDPEKFTDVENTVYGKYIISHTRLAISEYLAVAKSAVLLAGEEKIDKRNLPKAEEDISALEELLKLCSYEELHQKLPLFSMRPLSKSAGEEATEFYSRLSSYRPLLKADITYLATSFYAYSKEEWKALYAKLHSLLLTFYKFIKHFYSVFMEEKRRRGICEFSDVERYAYETLYNPDGSLTEVAFELRSKFDAVYVDEYQDVNGLQGKVFAAISREDNRFMVGDIKQSIYGFRSARPEIFAEMKETYPPLGCDGDYPYASIFMSQNFRCDRNVVDFVNGIFDRMFGLVGDSIGYREGDRLDFAKVYPDGSTPLYHVPEIHLVDKVKKTSPDMQTETLSSIIQEDNMNFRIMGEHIAVKIKELLEHGKLANGELIRPRDICIMMRSIKSKGEMLSDILKRHGISSSVEDSGNLFMSEEVLLALSFLYTIDNPRKDIYLTALMCSPLFSFTPDELLKIRKASSSETLWEALMEYVEEHPDYSHGVSFISAIERYRKLSEGQPTDVLISLIFRESGLLALAARNGGRENLTLFHSYARKYEETSFKGLYSFLAYITEVIEGREKFGTAKNNDTSEGVSIITIHKSKGLEFPVCFIANASTGFVRTPDTIRFSEDFGIALLPKDDTGLALVDNPVCHAIEHYKKKKEFEEELRVLYVALTRAREQLYVYAVAPRAHYVDDIMQRRDFLSPYFASKASSLLDIILLSRNCGTLTLDQPLDYGKVIFDAQLAQTAEESIAETFECSKEPDVSSTEEQKKYTLLKDEFVRRFSFTNPLLHLETLPEKISVSKLSPTVLDNSDGSEVELEAFFNVNNTLLSEIAANEVQPSDPEAPTLPSFITGTEANKSAKRGIATHMVLQFCDFNRLNSNGARAELERLVAEEYISAEDAERVRINEINAFVSSELFKEMKNAKKLYRELRFNVKLPAERFTSDESKKILLRGHEVLVQGVIDCIIEDEDGNLHLIDYKTDRLTKEERSCPELADARLRAAHGLQLSYYADAIEIMFGKRPISVGVYSLHAAREIKIDVENMANST